MKAITVLEPWASLIAYGAKTIETRSWKTNYRGILAIHASSSNRAIKNPMQYGALPAYIRLQYEVYNHQKSKYLSYDFNLGSIIAIVKLVDCQKIVQIIDEKIGKYIVHNNKILLENGAEINNGYDEYLLGDYTIGNYAWMLRDVRKIIPVTAQGRQRLWNCSINSINKRS